MTKFFLAIMLLILATKFTAERSPYVYKYDYTKLAEQDQEGKNENEEQEKYNYDEEKYLHSNLSVCAVQDSSPELLKFSRPYGEYNSFFAQPSIPPPDLFY